MRMQFLFALYSSFTQVIGLRVRKFTHFFQNLQIIEGTEQYDRWVQVPQLLDFKVYFLNVTNVDEIQRGMKPRVQEVGPYYYTWGLRKCVNKRKGQNQNFRQNRTKYNIRFSRDKERVSYYQQQTFHFNAEKSGRLTDSDSITIFNMYMNVSFYDFVASWK